MKSLRARFPALRSPDYNWFLSVLFPGDELKILPYNRVVKDLNGLTDDELRGALSRYSLIGAVLLLLVVLHFALRPGQVVEVSNEWGFMLEQAARQAWPHLLLVGHPGKMAKLAEGHWETHSSQSPSVLPLSDSTVEGHLSSPS